MDEDVVGGFDSCDDNDDGNDDDNGADDIVAGGYQQHVPSNLNYFDLRLCRDVPLFFEGSRHKGNEIICLIYVNHRVTFILRLHPLLISVIRNSAKE